MDVEGIRSGIETRLKKKQRGFYLDKNPNFAALRESHDKASRDAGEKKLAAENGVIAALAKFGLLNEKKKDPVTILSDLFKYQDFGLPTKSDPGKFRAPPMQRMLRDRHFSGVAPPASSGGSMEFSSAHKPDMSMAYQGV